MNFRRGICLRLMAMTMALGALLAVGRRAPGQPQGANPEAPPAAAEALAPDAPRDAPVIPEKNLLQIVRSGGVLMIPILFCSFLLVVFILERTIVLRRSNVIPRPFVNRFLDQLREGTLDQEVGLALCEENGSTVAEVFAAALRKWGKPAVEVEQAVLDSGERAVNRLRRHLRIFNGIATVAPLLGLLGTVTGMIKAFNDIAQQALGKPELLATGISEALLTTAAGLTVAIPALISYLYYVSRVDKLVMEIDALGQEVVNAISAEALAGAVKQKRARQSQTTAA